MRGQGSTQEAVGLINRAIEVDGEKPYLVDTRAVVRIRLGQSCQAVEELLAIRKLAPRNPMFALHLAWANQEQGRTAERRKAFQEALNLGCDIGRCDPLSACSWKSCDVR